LPDEPAPSPAKTPDAPTAPTKPKKSPAPRPSPSSGKKPSEKPSDTGASAPAKAPVRRPSAAPRPPKPAPPVLVDGTVVDASGLVLGRAASRIAKRLLNGERIIVVNAEKSVVTGARASVLEIYRANRARGSKRTGPHYPRYPDRIFRRTVRGMLPHLKTRGKVAFDRLEVHIGVPAAFASAARQSIDDAKAQPALRAPLTLEEISRLLGARV
jgi:large subunit ribosomal protein L13